MNFHTFQRQDTQPANLFARRTEGISQHILRHAWVSSFVLSDIEFHFQKIRFCFMFDEHFLHDSKSRPEILIAFWNSVFNLSFLFIALGEMLKTTVLLQLAKRNGQRGYNKRWTRVGAAVVFVKYGFIFSTASFVCYEKPLNFNRFVSINASLYERLCFICSLKKCFHDCLFVVCVPVLKLQTRTIAHCDEMQYLIMFTVFFVPLHTTFLTLPCVPYKVCVLPAPAPFVAQK